MSITDCPFGKGTTSPILSLSASVSPTLIPVFGDAACASYPSTRLAPAPIAAGTAIVGPIKGATFSLKPRAILGAFLIPALIKAGAPKIISAATMPSPRRFAAPYFCKNSLNSFCSSKVSNPVMSFNLKPPLINSLGSMPLCTSPLDLL